MIDIILFFILIECRIFKVLWQNSIVLEWLSWLSIGIIVARIIRQNILNSFTHNFKDTDVMVLYALIGILIMIWT